MEIKNPGDKSNSVGTLVVPEVVPAGLPMDPSGLDAHIPMPPPVPPVAAPKGDSLAADATSSPEPEGEWLTTDEYRPTRPAGLTLTLAPFESKKSKIIAVLVFLGLVVIVAVAGVIFDKAGLPGSGTSSTTQGDAVKKESSDLSATGASAEVGDVYVASIPTVGGDRQATVTAIVKRIVKLLPETGKETIDLKFCNEDGCHPMQPVPMGTDEALIALDLDLDNPATELDTAGSNSAYIMSQYLRFKVGARYEPVKSMAYNIFDHVWFEQEPTFYVSPSKRMTMTFFVRVPAATENVDFLYGPKLSQPLLRVPMSFRPSVPTPDMGAGTSNGGTEPSSSAQTRPTLTSESEQTRQEAVDGLKAFLSDWKNKYQTECVGREMDNECVLWKSGIEKIESTCFLDNLSATEITKCREDVFTAVFQAAFWSKVAESSATTTRTTVDHHGVDLAKLPEGKTVKVFENGPTEEVSFGNKTTVTYTRKGKTVTIEDIIVYEGDRGTAKYSQTVTLE